MIFSKEGECQILVSRDNDKLHLSISHENRYPTWDEIKAARYKYMPADMMVAMLLPPEGEYVNVHENCFHLWEIKEEQCK